MIPNELAELEALLVIHENKIDEEVAQQASIYQKVAKCHVEAATERDSLKEVLKTIDAVLDTEIRSKSKIKLTEAQVEAAIQTHPDHAKAFEDYLGAKHMADLWGVTVESFNKRSFHIGHMVSLAVKSFFQTSSVSAENVYNKQAMENLANARRRTNLTGY